MGCALFLSVTVHRAVELVVQLPERQTMCHVKYTTFDEGYLGSGRKSVVTSVMKGDLRI